jgi:hypothetical protein
VGAGGRLVAGPAEARWAYGTAAGVWAGGREVRPERRIAVPSAVHSTSRPAAIAPGTSQPWPPPPVDVPGQGLGEADFVFPFFPLELTLLENSLATVMVFEGTCEVVAPALGVGFGVDVCGQAVVVVAGRGEVSAAAGPAAARPNASSPASAARPADAAVTAAGRRPRRAGSDERCAVSDDTRGPSG